jgi:hypothetical protein
MSLVEYIIPSTLISLFVVDIYFYEVFKRHLCNDKFATTTLLKHWSYDSDRLDQQTSQSVLISTSLVGGNLAITEGRPVYCKNH